MSIVSLLLAIVVISALIYLLLKQKANKSTKQRSYKPDSSGSKEDSISGQLNYDLVKTKWADIVAMQSNGASGLKNALIEADKLLDYVMIHKGFSGETMGDRLKSGGSRFNNLNGVWAAHKLRNQIAHEVEHDIVPEQIKNAIAILKSAIQELGVTVQ
ncbi:MAG: hypothetical protein QG675_436 [Patescibacteria group bacterium]|jgi:hypothetical protein|nr:hypothetical protein [Patescibacteria group bacterium]